MLCDVVSSASLPHSCWLRSHRPRRSRPSPDPAPPPVSVRYSSRIPSKTWATEPDRPEGLGRRRSGGGLPRRHAHEPRRQRLPARGLGRHRQRDREPGVLADEHVPLHAAPGRVRAGDGLLLDHRGAEVHPEPRLRTVACGRSTMDPQRAADQPVGPRQLVRDRHTKDELRFGKGGVDDAEDAEVILHEYGHAIHFSQNFSFASSEAGAISEGFGDYWGVTVSDVVSKALGVRAREPCLRRRLGLGVVHIDLPHCLRRVDLDLHYPGDLNGEVHARRADLVAGALGHPRERSATSGPTRSSSRVVRLPGYDDDRPGEAHGRGSAAALRQRNGEQRSRCIHGARNPGLVVGRSTAERLLRRAARPGTGAAAIRSTGTGRCGRALGLARLRHSRTPTMWVASPPCPSASTRSPSH